MTTEVAADLNAVADLSNIVEERGDVAALEALDDDRRERLHCPIGTARSLDIGTRIEDFRTCGSRLEY